jgi:hypothetical protein
LGNREIVPDLARHVPELRRIITDYAQYGGDREFLAKRCVPLLKEVAASDQGGEQSSFGRVQAGVSAAYLGLAEEAYGRLKVMSEPTRRL